MPTHHLHPAAPADPAPPRVHNPPAPGQWAPIVIDQPAPLFEPRPAPGPYRPDTVCDGWATPRLEVRLASVRGDAHRYSGSHRQDHAAVVAHQATGTVLFAVMDGVSSARLSHLGAEAAGDAAVRVLWETLDRGEAVDWPAVLARAADALVRHRRYGLADGEGIADVERRLGTTIVTGLVRPTRTGAVVEMARAGDSGAWILTDSAYHCLLSTKSTGATLDTAVRPLPRVPDPVRPVAAELPAGAVLLVATDGLGDPLGDGTGLIGQLLLRSLRPPPPMLGLAHLVGFSRETFDDDRTLVAIWPRPAEADR